MTLMTISAKYVHTNLIAEDWRALARFYQEVFGCVPVPPERDFTGEKLEAGTGIPGAHLRGVHLRLPGYGDNGPTLEIFNYNILEPRPRTAVNRPGFGHIAFSVDDVAAARKTVLAAGGCGTIFPSIWWIATLTSGSLVLKESSRRLHSS